MKTHVQEARDAALLAPLPTRNGELRRRLRLVEQQLRSPFVEQQMFTDDEQCVIGVSSIGVFFFALHERYPFWLQLYHVKVLFWFDC